MKKSILDVVHETAKGLHKIGVMNTQTMQEFSALYRLPQHQPINQGESKAKKKLN